MAKTSAKKTGARPALLNDGRKAVLVVLFVPSVERDGRTPIDQGRWVDLSLNKDEPVVVHCYTTPADIQDSANLGQLGRFCRKLGREARQGEVGLVIGDEYFAIRDFKETSK
jgi:hypothetical protein